MAKIGAVFGSAGYKGCYFCNDEGELKKKHIRWFIKTKSEVEAEKQAAQSSNQSDHDEFRDENDEENDGDIAESKDEYDDEDPRDDGGSDDISRLSLLGVNN